MAPDYGVSDVTIYALLLREHEGVWKDVQAARALARMERTLVELEKADDVLKLGRARETLKGAMWELERVLRRIYGDEKQAASGVQVNIVMDFSSGDAQGAAQPSNALTVRKAEVSP
jgi:hypothetical protein